ncbi:MAG: hypothetical protein PVJ67_02455 [Candidatus Pacearchaeota archaeon]|jgi:hypothetical protein
MIGKDSPCLENVLKAEGLIFPEKFMRDLEISEGELCTLKNIYRQNATKAIHDFSKFLKTLSPKKMDLWRRATSYLMKTQSAGLRSEHYMGVALGMKPKIWGDYWRTGDSSKIVNFEYLTLDKSGKKYILEFSSGKLRDKGAPNGMEGEVISRFIGNFLQGNKKYVLVLNHSIPNNVGEKLISDYCERENLEILCNGDNNKILC